ncbi:MAG: type II secretion system protein GspL [Desulfobulbales bacterium]|nr:type II secretion system protein GspL [Desulfobulbales bacterium]
MKSTKKEHFLFLGSEAPEKVHWAERPAYGAVVTGQGTLAEALHLRGEKVVVLIAGQDVLLTEVNIPGGRGRLVKKSLPYALEENLTEDVDTLHFAHGPTGRTGAIPVAVAAKERMEAWLEILHEHGIEIKSMVPATMAVPLTPEHWSLVVSGDGFMLRKDAWHAYAGDLDSLPLFLAGTSGEAGSTPPVSLYLDQDFPADLQADLPEINAVATRKEPLLQVLAEGYNEKAVIDLLQGDYGRHAGWREMWQKWRVPAVAAAVLIVLNITGFAIDYFCLKSENQALAKRIETVYLKTFPTSRRIVNARAQMEQKIVELEGAGAARDQFFEIYDRAAPLLIEAAGFSLTGLRFNNGRFDFDFEIEDLQALEKLKNNLAGLSGISMDIKNAESVGGKVKTKIQIKGLQ